jgi:hypothetical protein
MLLGFGRPPQQENGSKGWHGLKAVPYRHHTPA